MSFVEEVQRRVYAKTLLYTPWLPTERMQVGDYGSVRRGRFNREGNVRQRGITFEEDVATASPARLGFSDRASFNAKGVAKGRARPHLWRGAQILQRTRDLAAQLLGGDPGPVRSA